MSGDLDAVHRALAAQIDAYIDDDWNVSPWPESGSPEPLIEVWPGNPYHTHTASFGANGHSHLQVEVRLFVDGANAETVFKRMTRALAVGAAFGSSVIDAIASDRTLDGNVSTLIVGDAEWDVGDGGLSAVGTIPVDITLRKTGAQP